MPKISVLCSAYNAEKYFPQCIESVLGQTFTDFEFLIYDDGSSDKTLEIARSFGDKRLKVLFDGKNLGPNTRYGQLMEMARGEYVGWIDADDIIEKTALWRTHFVLDEYPHHGLVYTDHFEIDEMGNLLRLGPRSKEPYSPDQLLRNFMTFHFRLFRRELYSKIEPLERTPHKAQDYELCLKMSEVTNFMHLPLPLYYYRLHPESVTKTVMKDLDQAVLQLMRDAIKRRGLNTHVEMRYEDGNAKYKFINLENSGLNTFRR